MEEEKDWQRFGSQIKQDTREILNGYVQDYGLEIRQVVDQALNFFFKMSGYGVDGYSVLLQKKAAEDFNTLEDLPAPSLACQERNIYSSFVAGDLNNQSPEIRQLVQAGDTVKARRVILGGEE